MGKRYENGRKKHAASVGKELGRPVTDVKLNPKMWKAVLYHFRGMTKSQALITAGYSENYARSRSGAVFGRDDVKRELARLRNNMTMRSYKIVERTQDELAKIAFFNLSKVLRVTDGGDLIFNFEDVSEDDLAAIGEVTIETYTEGQGEFAEEVKRVKVKPYNKKDALDSLARIHGMFQDNMNLTSDGMSLEERIQAGRRRLKKPDPIDAEFEEVSRDTTEGEG